MNDKDDTYLVFNGEDKDDTYDINKSIKIGIYILRVIYKFNNSFIKFLITAYFFRKCFSFNSIL